MKIQRVAVINREMTKERQSKQMGEAHVSE